VNLGQLIESAERAFSEGQEQALTDLSPGFQKFNLKMISAHSELSAQLQKREYDYSAKLQDLIQETLDTYRDLEEAVNFLLILIRDKDHEEFEEVLEEIRECAHDLDEVAAEMNRLQAAEEAALPQIQEEWP